MTELLERTEDAAAPPHARVPKPSRLARWNAGARIARRQVRRAWTSSLLVMILIALPIAGMVAGSVFVSSMRGTPTEMANIELGRMHGWVKPAGVPDSGFWQMPGNPTLSGYPSNGRQPDGEIPVDPLAALPAGTETVEVSQGQVHLRTRSGLTTASAWAGGAGDARFAGRFDLIDGRAPRNAGEVLVTPATLERTGASVGGTVEADDQEYTIVGTVRVAALPSSASALYFFDAGRLGDPTWYLPALSLTWPQMQDLNADGIAAYARDVALDPPAFQPPTGDTFVDPATQELYAKITLVSTLAAGGLAAAYTVVMLAGAAFAVSARRQQRALAIAASVGADARDLRRVVRLQGTVLGVVGGVVGLGLGIALASIVIPIVSDGSATMFPGFHVPWELLAGILVFAVLVGTASALMPARGVARTDALRALRGARTPQKVRASRPLWGSLLLVIGVALTIVCGVAAANAVNQQLPWDSPLRSITTVGIVAGPVIVQLGIVLSGRWLLWLCSLALSKLGIAARIASRDAVANGARTVPAFAAIGATVFAGVFALGMGAMTTGQAARSYSYQAPIGTAVGSIGAWGDGMRPPTADAAEAGKQAILVVYREVGATSTAEVDQQPQLWAEDAEDIPADMLRAVAVTPERSLLDPESVWETSGSLQDPQNNIAVIAPDDLETVTGIALGADRLREYAAGAALVTDAGLVTDGAIRIAAWTERQWQSGGAPNNVLRPQPDDPPIADPQWSRNADAIVVSAPDQPVLVAIAPQTAADLGITALPTMVFGGFDEPVTTDQRDRMEALGQTLDEDDDYSTSIWVEEGPAGMVWLAPLLAVVAVLVLGSSAVALGFARFERRPDDATLSAVGGTRLLRRNIGFWQGLVIAGFGTFAGAVAGILPPIGFWLRAQASPQPLDLADIPWWLLVALAVLLPLAIALANWLVPPRHPDLTRRVAIA